MVNVCSKSKAKVKSVCQTLIENKKIVVQEKIAIELIVISCFMMMCMCSIQRVTNPSNIYSFLHEPNERIKNKVKPTKVATFDLNCFAE